MTVVFLGVEDALSEAVGRVMLHSVLGKKISIMPLRRNGFGYLYTNISKFVQTANRDIVLVLTDLDHKQCAPTLKSEWLKNINLPQRMSFRVVVREIEAWLLADRDNMAGFLGISAAKIPIEVELILQPKERLLALAQGAPRELREDLLPRKGARAVQGLGYNSRLIQFVQDHWDINRARLNSDSLDRAIRRVAPLNEFVA